MATVEQGWDEPMGVPELPSQHERIVEEAAREAAAYVLAHLDGTPAHEFVQHLTATAPRKQVAIVSSLVHLVSRTAVESADMATFKLKLRLMAREPLPED